MGAHAGVQLEKEDVHRGVLPWRGGWGWLRTQGRDGAQVSARSRGARAGVGVLIVHIYCIIY